MKNKILCFIVVLFLGVSLCACKGGGLDSNSKNQMQELYELYTTNGGELTYEEWLSTIKGEKGDSGNDGISISKIQLSSSKENVDTYTIYYSDGTTSTFTVTNGTNGEQGIQGVPGKDGHTPVITIGTNGNWYVDGVDSGTKAQGPKGDKGDAGTSITSISFTSSKENVDTYTIYYSDGTTSAFTVTNGTNGEQGIQGVPGNDGHTPVITIGTNGNWYVDGVDSETKAQGPKGDQGDTGLSAYEIYIKYHPDYEGTEEEWLEDLVNGNLREQYVVKFNSNGGSTVESQKINYGHLVSRPYDPTKTGYLFDGWYLNGELFPFNSYQVFDSITLVAHWKKNTLNVTLNSNGGEIPYNTKSVVYGSSYELPVPIKENYIFEGWYRNDTDLCPISGNWDFSVDDVILTAKWSGTVCNISFTPDSNITFNSETIYQIEYGKYFELPVPTILSGDVFIGWGLEDGTLITDADGASLKKSSFKNDVELKAIYYITISKPSELLSLSGLSIGDPLLNRTYVLTNDLDFEGLSNEPIRFFNGKLEGNNHLISNLTNSLFESIGSVGNSSADVTIANIRFVNYNGNSIIDNVIACNSLEISNIIIESFKKDVDDKNNFNGIIDVLGNAMTDVSASYDGKITSYSRNYAKSVSINNIHILESNVNINCGLINFVNYVENLSIDHCIVYSNTSNAAFINSSRMATYFDYKNTISRYEGSSYAANNVKAINCEWNISISNCSNYGESSKLIDLCCADTYTGSTRYESSKHWFDGQVKISSSKVTIKNLANYGDLSSYAFINSALYTDCIQNSSGDYYERKHIYTLPNPNNYSISYFVNFGKIKGIAKSNPEGYSSSSSKYTNPDGASFSSVPYSYNSKPLNYFITYSANTMSIYSSFNGGNTLENSTSAISSFNSNYCYEPYTNLSGEEYFNYISNINQITSDFFSNTLNFDDNWDLSYIKIDDEYGRPFIVFD